MLCPHPSSVAFLSALSSQQQVSHLTMASNMVPTLPAQDDQLVTGCRLTSRSCVYTVQSFLGQGTFGKVAKCTRMDDMRTVAVKMIKNQGSHAMLAHLEVGKETGHVYQSLSCTFFMIMLQTLIPPAVLGEITANMYWLV